MALDELAAAAKMPKSLRSSPTAAQILTTAAVLWVIFIATLLMVMRSPRVAEAGFWIGAAGLVCQYLGYPLVLAVVRSQRRPSRSESADDPHLTLFVAANDEEAVIRAKVENALSLNYSPWRLQVVVASDGSVDRTNSIVTSFSDRGVRLLAFPERRGKIAAINAGMSDVQTDVVIFSDANAFLRPDAARALVRNLADPSVGAVSGDVVLTGDRADLAAPEDLYYRYERWLQRAESDAGCMIGVDGALYAIRRSLFQPAPNDTILDDLALPMNIVRQGYRVVYEPDALAFEHGSRSAREEFWRKTRIIAGAVQFLRRSSTQVPWNNPQVLFSLFCHKVLRWFSPVLLALTFTASFRLADASWFYRAASLAQAAFLALGVVGCWPATRRLKLFSLTHYFLLVHAAAAVGLVSGVTGQQTVRWRRFARQTLDQYGPVS